VTDVHIKYFLKTDEKATKALDPPVVCRSDMQDKWHCLHIYCPTTLCWDTTKTKSKTKEENNVRIKQR